MFNFLGGTPEQPGDADNPLRVFNGGPFPAKYVGAFEKRFGVKCLELYGNVESGCMTRSPYDAHRPGSCGKAADEYEVRIVDEYDNPVPPGTVGEFVCRTKEPWTFMTGYYKMPDKTADTFRNLWLHTGDGGKMDEDGYFYFVDRIKDAMRKRGENISSFEVEKVINSHPKIQESAAYGIKSTEWTEDEVMVAIVLKPGETLAPEELIAFCEDRMAAFAVPRFVEFKTTLPKTPTERVEKYKLKAEGVTAATWDRMAANP
jgi:crotonobetaine/carnitine-CoA ligase